MPRWLRTVALVALVLAPLTQTGCLQDISAEPDRAIVAGDIEFAVTDGEANVRVDLAGTANQRDNNSRDLILTDAGFTDEEGRFAVPTRTVDTDEVYLVLRHPDYDVEIARVPEVLSAGRTTTVTAMFPTPLEEVSDEPELVPLAMTRKQPGRVKFIYAGRTESTFPGFLSVKIIGDFNGFSKTSGFIEMFDDGSGSTMEDDDGNEFVSGDAFQGDRIYTRIVEGLPPGLLRYNIFLSDSVLLRDPMEEGFEQMVDENNLRVVRSVVRVF